MKELKFRVWDKERETFLNNVFIGSDETYRITWNGCFSSFDLTNIDKTKQYKDLYTLNRDYQKSEIVGNIYQNKELLENK